MRRRSLMTSQSAWASRYLGDVPRTRPDMLALPLGCLSPRLRIPKTQMTAGRPQWRHLSEPTHIASDFLLPASPVTPALQRWHVTPDVLQTRGQEGRSWLGQEGLRLRAENVCHLAITCATNASGRKAENNWSQEEKARKR